MNWLNLELKTLRSTEYLGADPVQRATWINLLSFCADHENGGFIADASNWGDRKWMQLVGITLSEVTSECGLWEVLNGGVSVKHYPVAQEQKVKRNRRNGKKGGRPSTDKPDGLPCGYPDGLADGSVSLKRNSNSNRKEIVKETNVADAPAEANKQAKEIATHYNSVRGAMPECIKVTAKREAQINARIKEVGFDELKRILTSCKDMPHLQGENDRGWTGDLEWITRDGNFIKIREGKYKTNKPAPKKVFRAF